MTILPPAADRRPHSFTTHGVTLTDDYAWLKDAGYPDVTDPDILAYLEAENAYFEGVMAPHRPLVDRLYEEMKARIKEDESTVPQKDGDWLYWSAFETGGQYRKWWRRPVAGGPDELLLDEPALAEGHEYFRLGAFSISNNGRLLAYAVDDNGSERFTVRVKDLATGNHRPEIIPDMLSDIVWTADDSAFLYGVANDQWRTDNALLHRLGTAVADDIELYHEDDEGFRVSVGETSARNWIVIATGDHVTSEIRLVPANDPSAEPIVVRARQTGLEYDVDEHEGLLYVHTNDTDTQWRLCTATLAAPGEWTELIAPDPHFYMTGVSCFRDYFVVEGREDGLDQVAIHRYDAPTKGRRIAFPEASYDAGLGDNPEWAMDVLRLGYQSMVTPGTIYDYDVASGALTVRKVQEIPSGYDAGKYRTERLHIAARDGTDIPVSIVYPKDFARDGSGPLYLYGYGAYGMAIAPGFSTGRLSLLDRGFAFAIAHIRGGDDLGQQWYHDGKLDKRINTFTDFVDVAKGLIEGGWTGAGRIAIAGGSAGGELMGAVVNSDPALWGAVVADVPFVDVLNTMLDADLPLTPGEWPEWGNPIEDEAAFHLIRSYSPYDLVKPQAYPPLFISGGLNDPRVTYWEPAKWAAKLRATKTDDNILLLKTNMGAGHGGKSGRFESLREVAEEHAFILWQFGIEGEAAGMNLAEIITHYGLPALFLGGGFEGETVVVIGGILAHKGLVSLPGAMAATAAGSFVADQIYFLIGRRATGWRLVQKLKSNPLYARAMAMLERHPIGFIFAFRFIYGFRTISPFAIGTSDVPARLFLIVNAIAAVIWASTFTLLGYIFGREAERWLGRFEPTPKTLAIAAGVVVVAALALHVGRKWWRADNAPKDDTA